MTIYDNDIPTVSVSATDDEAAETRQGEDADTGTFVFSRNGSTGRSLTVSYSLAGTAGNGTDYSTLDGSVTFEVGSSTASVTVSPVDDTEVEDDETVELSLSSGTGYTLPSGSSSDDGDDRGR